MKIPLGEIDTNIVVLELCDQANAEFQQATNPSLPSYYYHMTTGSILLGLAKALTKGFEAAVKEKLDAT